MRISVSGPWRAVAGLRRRSRQVERESRRVVVPGRQRQADAEPARLRLTVLDSPCRCREPLIAPDVRSRSEILLDLRDTHFQDQLGPVLQAGYPLSDRECLRVLSRTVSWPLMAALQASGYRYQIVRREPGDVEFLVWLVLTGEVRERYLEGRMEYRPEWRLAATVAAPTVPITMDGDTAADAPASSTAHVEPSDKRTAA